MHSRTALTSGGPCSSLGGHGLFDIHVLARTAGVRGNLWMQIVPGGHDDTVDILTVEQLMVVGVLLDLAAGKLCRFVAPKIPGIANRDPFDVGALVGFAHQISAPASRSNDSDAYAIAGRR